MSTRRRVLTAIASGTPLVTAGCVDWVVDDPTTHDILLRNRDDDTRTITLTVFDDADETLIDVTEELEPRTISEGHSFEGVAASAIAAGHGQEDEQSIEWGDAGSACHPDGTIRIDAAFDAEGELTTDYIC